MREAIRDPAELCRQLRLPPEMAKAGGDAAEQFSVFVPRGYLAKMVPGDPADPLLAQVLPREKEMAPTAGFTTDPVAESSAQVGPHVLQKYPGRALLVATSVCAVHCRYCFRRHFPYQEVGAEGDRRGGRFDAAVDHIASDSSLEEIILSGGDPLTLTDAPLADLASRLAKIPHLRRLRLHTRLPIVIPERVTGELVDWLRSGRLTPIVVVHANHPRELCPAVTDALGRLVEAGIPVLNQAVLLAGVNDRTDVLEALSRRLVDARVMPYYLHQLDRVAGAAHFEVPPERGRELIGELQAQLPGYAVPRYVAEVPGEASKRAV